MLRGKLKGNQEDWDLQLQPCMMAYRSSVHESTGETPNMLMLGREIEVPLDVITELAPDTLPLTTEYAVALQQRLASAHEAARRHLGKATERQKRNYDNRVSNKPYRVGDSVWLHNIRRKKGRNPKLDCPWEGPFLVVSVLSDVTYRIQKSHRAKPKVIHADRLKPYLGPALKSWISEKEEAVTPAESRVVSAGEIEPSTGVSGSAVSREGEPDGNDAMESLDSVICSSPQEAGAMSDDAKSDVEISGTEVVAASGEDAEIPPSVHPAMLTSRQPGETEDCGTPSRGHSSQNVKVQSRFGRERRQPKCYGDWV